VFCFDHVRLALPLLPLMRGGLIKTVIFAHGSESWKRLRAGNRAAFRSASLCITNSHFTLKKMREKISKFQGVACPLGLSPEFPLNIEIPQKHFSHMELTAADGRTRTLSNRIILLVARMDQKEGQKGHRALINIMPKLLEEFPEAQLVFPGPGDDTRNLQKLAESIGIAPSVFLPGFVSAEVLGCLYRRCYMFAMPSKQEGFGLAYLEAMNYAKPCIGCFNQGAEDVIIDGETGFLIHDPNDPAELLRVIRTLLQEPERARTFGIAGFNRLHEHFTSSQYQNRVKEQIAKFL
ncbi:MAG TPA: glycosyltransferase family 4 protein, partial [Candidatus Hodarchaeales archaeon]|nr:glycosyltransferase family 4 protein [Candidatus Hodarchaeales archaeon]